MQSFPQYLCKIKVSLETFLCTFFALLNVPKPGGQPTHPQVCGPKPRDSTHTSKWSKLCGASLFVEISEAIFVQIRNCLLYFLLFTFLKNLAAIIIKEKWVLFITQSKLSFCWSPLRVAGQIGGVSTVQNPPLPAPANPPHTPAQTRSLEAYGTVTGTHVFHTQNRVQTLFITETFNRLIFNFHTEQRAAVYRVSGLSCPEAGGCKSVILRGFPDVFSLFGP